MAMIPKMAVKLKSASIPLDFITKTITAIATAISIQKIIIVGASSIPISFRFINAIPVIIRAGKQIAISSTYTGLINKPLSVILFGIVLVTIDGIISENQMK